MRGVSQISMPIRIVVAAAAVFLVAWMTVLKPKTTEDVAAPTPITTGNVATGKPAVSAPGKLAEKAKSAVENANQKQSAALGEPAGSAATNAAPATATKTTPSAPAAKPAAKDDALAGVPARVAKAIRHQKVVIVGFFGPKAADDRDVRKAMFKADRWDGRVFVTSASIDKVSKWGRIARGVDVQQSPTVVVIGTDLKATPLVGYVDTRSINQAVVDSLHNTGGLFTNAKLAEINKACTSANNALYATPAVHNRKQLLKAFDRNLATLSGFVHDLRAVKVGAPLKSFKRAMVADATTVTNAMVRFDNVLTPKDVTAGEIAAGVKAYNKDAVPAGKSFNKRAKKNHLLSCQEI
jgi:hypothetical protein